ncbi:hypothetical protein [Micromonospora cathayae]|uniref:Uncharacterized protein n=1 Tax=Micromonospora cathayae TaxID=3028804 RepID=A0ABY7ZW39_9ACTN|nr:hypothetical protein [Micromonospora sp. HUAS 3]WDZ87205.1 hypothetical protein PVK37_12755 [Micromonospora sp. HUAS 3]
MPTCDCCGKALAGDIDNYPEPLFAAATFTSLTRCGNCDGGEQPDCPNCSSRPWFGGDLAGLD